MIALVPAPLQERGRFGVGPGHDETGHLHDVELQAGRVQPLDLLVHADEHLPRLVPALLGARLLVLDVVARDPGLDEAADQIPDVRVAAVSGVGVGDDEWPVVDLGGGSTLRLAQPQAGETLVPVRREQGAHDRRGLIRHLGERIAGQVGSRVLRHRSPGRRGPAAQVDALDAHPLHGHRLTGRIGTEGRDLLALGEELPEPIIELLGRHSRHGVVGGNSAPLLHHLTRRIQPREALEPGTGKPPCGLADFRLERAHGWVLGDFRIG